MKLIHANFNHDVIRAIRGAIKSNNINPLYIYGPSGTGKTFLVKKMKNVFSGKKKLVNASNFHPANLDKYIEFDLLILEDIQLLSVRSPIPETLFELTSYFINQNNQIVFTSDRPPVSLNMPERIISRIETGVSVAIKRFDEESKKKVIYELGKDMPDEIIEKLIETDIQTISQAIGAIKKAKLLGYVPEEEIEKSTPPRKKRKTKKPGEFDSFLDEVKKDIPETITESERESNLREEYRSKMYVWEMKGFNVDSIKKVIEGPIDRITSEFVEFTMNIQRLIELQRRYGQIKTDYIELSEDKKNEIEKKLFDPNSVEWLNRKIGNLENKQQKMKTSEIKNEQVKVNAESDGKTADKIKTDMKDIDVISDDMAFSVNNLNFRLIREF